MDKLLAEQKKRLEASRAAFEEELATIRTGQATPALLNHIRVEYYGEKMPLNQLANISTQEGRLLVIAPWDRSLVPAVEKAILTSDLGINPTSDGTVIRLAIPPLSQERREELAKQVARKAEEARVAIRNVRRDTISTLEKRGKAESWSEDEIEVGKKEIQKSTDAWIEKVDQIAAAKAQEVTEL